MGVGRRGGTRRLTFIDVGVRPGLDVFLTPCNGMITLKMRLEELKSTEVLKTHYLPHPTPQICALVCATPSNNQSVIRHVLSVFDRHTNNHIDQKVDRYIVNPENKRQQK